MAKSKSITGLLVALVVIITAIVVIISMMQEPLETQKHVSNETLSSIGTMGNQSVERSSSSIISTRFYGEYDKNGQTVVLSKNGEYYVVEDGYVLTSGVHIDARDEENVQVYEFDKSSN